MLSKSFYRRQLTLGAILLTILVLMVPAARHALGQSRDVMQLGITEARIIELPRNAAAVVVSRPEAMNALLDTPRRLILIPRSVSATALTVIDERGRTILDADVMISGRDRQSVRVLRGCAGSGRGCAPSTVEFCADRCVTIGALSQIQGGGPGSSSLRADGDGPSNPEDRVSRSGGVTAPATRDGGDDDEIDTFNAEP